MRLSLLVVGFLLIGVLVSSAVDRFVATNGITSGEFTSWETAASSIQLAVNKATDSNDTVWVSNGIYFVTSEITVTNKNKVTVKSVSGYSSTIVCADWPSYTTRCFKVANGAVVDGFTLTNGHSTAIGGGAYISTTGAIHNSYFVNNINSADHGGGACVDQGVVSNCTFVGNSVSTNKNGAGVYLADGMVLNCTFKNNAVTGNGVGGGVYLVKGLVSGGVITSNNAAYGGGGVYAMGGTVSGVLICSNRASTYSGGGGVYVGQNTVVVTNCAIVDNSSNVGGGGVGFADTPAALVVDCLIAGNASTGGGSGRHGGGGVFVLAGIVDRCRIASNRCSASGNHGGGGVKFGIGQGGVVRNSLIYNNTNSVANGFGGGVCITNAASTSTHRLINCTVVNNYSVSDGGGIAVIDTSMSCYVGNCVIRGNSSAANNYPEVYNTSGHSNDYWNCLANIPPAPLPPGQGNKTGDPLFVDASAGNWHVRYGSPCIDAGTNDVSWMSTATDLDGMPRIRNETVDIGAFESTPPTGTIVTIH